MMILAAKFKLTLSQVGSLVYLQEGKRFDCAIDKFEKSDFHVRKFISQNKPSEEWVSAVNGKTKLQTIALGNYYDSFIEDRLKEGLFKNASEVIRACLRLLE